MNVFSTPPAKSLLYPCSRRSAIAFPAFATSLAPTFFPAPPSLDSRNPGQNPGSPDRRAKGLEAILKFYASDAAFLQPTGEGITGSAALRTLFQTIKATFDNNLTLHSQNLETSGDLAYDSGAT